MKKHAALFVIAAVAAITVIPASVGAQADFMRGVNTHMTTTGPIEHILEIGANWHAPFLVWRHVEPEIDQVDLTVDDVRADPSMIDAYIDGHDWSRYDSVIDDLLASGLKVFPVIGQCFTGGAPRYQGHVIIPHEPDRPLLWYDNPYGHCVFPVGRENYLGHLYLHIRAVVRRYKDEIGHWMVDPEMNQSALFRVFGGWKAGRAWAEWDYVTRVLETLSAGVRDEDPGAVVCLPFNVDQPWAVTESYARTALLSGGVSVLDWPDAITDWLPYIDMVGVDFFESQGNPDPNCYARLRGRVETAVERAQGKPVAVCSVGVPSGPEALGWTEDNQATYVGQAFDAAVDAGACGFFYFGFATSDTHHVEITDFDVETMASARAIYNAAWDKPTWLFKLTLLWWTFELVQHFQEVGEPNPLLSAVDYCTNRFFPVLETAEGYWGLVRRDGTVKPSFTVLQDRFGSVAPPGQPQGLPLQRSAVWGADETVDRRPHTNK